MAKNALASPVVEQIASDLVAARDRTVLYVLERCWKSTDSDGTAFIRDMEDGLKRAARLNLVTKPEPPTEAQMQRHRSLRRGGWRVRLTSVGHEVARYLYKAPADDSSLP